MFKSEGEKRWYMATHGWVPANKICKDSCVNSRRNAATGFTSKRLPERKVIVPNFKNSFRKSRQGILWLWRSWTASLAARKTHWIRSSSYLRRACGSMCWIWGLLKIRPPEDWSSPFSVPLRISNAIWLWNGHEKGKKSRSSVLVLKKVNLESFLRSRLT